MAEHWIAPRVRELNAWLAAHPEVEHDGPFEAPPPNVGGWVNVRFEVMSTRPEHPDAATDCLTAAAKCLEILARGQRTEIRVLPEPESNNNFETSRRCVSGYVRFAVGPEEGEWHLRSVPGQVIYCSVGR